MDVVAELTKLVTQEALTHHRLFSVEGGGARAGENVTESDLVKNAVGLQIFLVAYPHCVPTKTEVRKLLMQLDENHGCCVCGAPTALKGRTQHCAQSVRWPGVVVALVAGLARRKQQTDCTGRSWKQNKSAC